MHLVKFPQVAKGKKNKKNFKKVLTKRIDQHIIKVQTVKNRQTKKFKKFKKSIDKKN